MASYRRLFSYAISLAAGTLLNAPGSDAGTFSAGNRYQQQATKTCAPREECTLPLKKIPASKQVIIDTISCENIVGTLPYFDVYDDGELLFHVAIPGQGPSRLLPLVIDPSHKIQFVTTSTQSLAASFSCLITGTIRNKN